MRFLCVVLGIASCVTIAVTSIPVPSAMVEPAFTAPAGAVPDEAAFLLKETERIRVSGSPEDCAALSPIPLYDGAPSATEWETYCLARMSDDAGRCADIPAKLLPDLRTSCLAASAVPDSL